MRIFVPQDKVILYPTVKKKKFIPRTTDSDRPFHVYPNLVKDLKVRAINQLWVADITYIRLIKEFVYLAVIMDVCSRRCVGWNLSVIGQ